MGACLVCVVEIHVWFSLGLYTPMYLKETG